MRHNRLSERPRRGRGWLGAGAAGWWGVLLGLVAAFPALAVDIDANGIDDAVEIQLAERFKPGFVLHEDRIVEPEPVEIMLSSPSGYLHPEDLSLQVFTLNGGRIYTGPFCNWSDGLACQENNRLHLIHGGLVGEELWLPYFDYGGPDNQTEGAWPNTYQNGNGYVLPAAQYDPKVYVHFHIAGSNCYIQYWAFYPYNDGVNNHEGDWEHIAVRISSTNPATAQVQQVYFFAHDSYMLVEGANLAKMHFVDDTHPVIFVGGHGVYSCANETGYGETSGASFPCSGTFSSISTGMPCGPANENVDLGGKYLHYTEIEAEIIPNFPLPATPQWDGNVHHTWLMAHPEKQWAFADVRWGFPISEMPWIDWATVPIVDLIFDIFNDGNDLGQYSPLAPARQDTWYSVTGARDVYSGHLSTLTTAPALAFLCIAAEGEVVRGEEIGWRPDSPGVWFGEPSPAYVQASQAAGIHGSVRVPHSFQQDGTYYEFLSWSDGILSLERRIDSNAVSTDLAANYRALSPEEQLLVSPADGAALASPELVTLDWIDVEGAIAYVYQTSLTPYFAPGDIVVNSGSTVSSAVLPAFGSSMELWWRVQPAFSTGLGEWSETRRFTYDYSFMAYLFLPGMNSVNVSLTESPGAIFNHAIDPATVTTTTFQLRGEQSGPIAHTTLIMGNVWLRALPSEAVKPGERLFLTGTSGIHSVDPSEPLANPFSVSYRTAAEGNGEYHHLKDLTQPEGSTGTALADLDGDGDLDIAAVQRWANRMTVILNQGNGNFSAFTAYPVGPDAGAYYNPAAVVAADFDRDGDIDLATANAGNYTWSYFRNYGNGTFAPATVYSRVPWPAGSPDDILAADVDNDGDLDVICGTVDSVLLFKNQGNGTFNVNFTTYPVTGQARQLCLGDLNNDGWVDVAAASRTTSQLFVLLNNRNGGFGGATAVSAQTNAGPIACEDLDGDHDLDIVVGQYLYSGTNSQVRVYWNDGLGGFGTYTSKTISGYEQTGIEFVDANGDGAPDVVVAKDYRSTAPSELAVLTNAGNGTFSDPVYVNLAGTGGDYYQPRGLRAGDLNGDGTMDLVTSNFYPYNTSVVMDLALPATVVLTSPPNGAALDMPSPHLHWQDQGGFGMTYTVQVDTESSFSAPIQRQITRSEHYWAVTPDLGDGTYYWRVRANNIYGNGPWSEVRSFGIALPAPSCPVLYAHDGQDFQAQNPLLTACERSGYVEVVTDHYLLPEAPAVVDGQVRFQIRELENEITYLDDLALLTVDHAEESEILCTVDGQIIACSRTLAPSSAVDQDGRDVLALVQARDGREFQAGGAGHVVVTFDEVLADGSGFSVIAPKKTPCLEDPPLGGGKSAVAAAPAVKVEVREADGSWREVTDLPVRQWAVMESFAVGGGLSGPVTLRLSWSDGFATDVVWQYVAATETPLVRTWQAGTTALQKGHPETSGEGSLGSGEPVELRKGDVLEFSFTVPEAPEKGMTRSYVVRATGRYQPDFSMYTRLLPTRTKLHANYPNPFGPATAIRFDLPASERVKVSVHDAQGRLVRTLVDGVREAGSHALEWNGHDEAGRPIPGGVYFCTMQAGKYNETRKMILLK